MLKKTPRIIATGFTTSLLGDERTLREFIIGDSIRERFLRKGDNAVLYLINDNYDPLNYRQLRIGVNKDEKLIKRFEKYCGHPISEVPDPFDCHKNYSQHFAMAILDRLHSLDIFPVMLNTYNAYKKGYYSEFIDITLKNYSRIKETLSQNFNNYSMKKLFYVQCPKCRCIDATEILEVAGDVIRFKCERCGRESSQDIEAVRGKLSWKLDCAARWNIYDIDIETFSKAHVAELGSFDVSRFISKHFYGGKVPGIIRYGDVKISRELSNKLLEILPPRIIKQIFTDHLTRDIDLNKESVEHYCSTFHVRSGLSYTDYVLRELPKDVLIYEGQNNIYEGINKINDAAGDYVIDRKTLVTFGKHFSRFYYNKEYGLRFPKTGDFFSADSDIKGVSLKMIQYAISIRSAQHNENNDIEGLIRCHLKDLKVPPGTYQFVRRILGQSEGPSIPTLLSVLPKGFLAAIEMILTFSSAVTHVMNDIAIEPQLPLSNEHSGNELNSSILGHKALNQSKLTNKLLEAGNETVKTVSPDNSPSCIISGMPEGC